MPDDIDKLAVTLGVITGDAETMRTALEEEGIEVREVHALRTSGVGPLIAWLITMVIEGAAWDMSKFVATRGAKGLKRLIKHLQEKSGEPDRKGTLALQDATKTTLKLESDLPEAAYKALEKLNWSEFVGKNLSWHEPPGAWKADDPPKITQG